jgi:VCBS repeat-containing protein
VSGTLVATDVDNATLTYSVVNNGTKGTAIVTNATGAYTYTANAGASGTDTFTFKANDGSSDSNDAVITVTISGGNAPPVANGATLTTPEDKSVSGRLTATDPEGSRLTFALVTNGTMGTASIATNGRFTYVPQANVHGTDSFTFLANDGISNSNVATVQVTISPVNDAPAATGTSVSTVLNQPVTGSLQAVDVDGDAITFSLAKGPRRGAVTINPTTGAFTYTPPTGFTGNDLFTFRAADPTGASSTATVSIAVSQ